MSTFKERSKDWLLAYKNQIFWVTIVILTASLSFAFGFLVAQRTNHSPIFIEKCSRVSTNQP